MPFMWINPDLSQSTLSLIDEASVFLPSSPHVPSPPSLIAHHITCQRVHLPLFLCHLASYTWMPSPATTPPLSLSSHLPCTIRVDMSSLLHFRPPHSILALPPLHIFPRFRPRLFPSVPPPPIHHFLMSPLPSPFPPPSSPQPRVGLSLITDLLPSRPPISSFGTIPSASPLPLPLNPPSYVSTSLIASLPPNQMDARLTPTTSSLLPPPTSFLIPSTLPPSLLGSSPFSPFDPSKWLTSSPSPFFGPAPKASPRYPHSYHLFHMPLP
ncbi:hypothetical protein AMTR_s00017p00253740 [Amborella trichopoda]|uniref:Uncharacterized protein n=1 Tax=Amborella trichopoda TaxID=13333 RepID=W1PLZ9_AMBTC|nr:hypothetical protein AMTR_s00017p00253740 [Amborella trichopoda]